MRKYVGKITKTIAVFAFMFACVCTAYAYNTKFAFDLTSGALSPWAYSSYATKYSEDENPVVECTYSSNSDIDVTYTVRNSDNEDRVVTFTQAGTFDVREFERNTTVQNKMYKLGVKRESGSIVSSVTSQGLWNIDSY